MKIYTKTGDKGDTSLFGGQRVTKNNLRVESYGTVDELNAILGVCAATISNNNALSEVYNCIIKIQNELFILGSEIACVPGKESKLKIKLIDSQNILEMEGVIDEIDKKLEPLNNFILPGGSVESANLHVARTVCRRLERSLLSIDIKEEILTYVNRLSDYIFVLARYVNFLMNFEDVQWNPREYDPEIS
jgi:cob(I)alamin adenosyltransferase